MGKLALTGGHKIVDRPIGSPWPIHDGREKQALVKVLESGQWGKTGCPIRCPLYASTMDYAAVRCPEAERIHATEAVDIYHRFLLGPLADMDLILGAMRKIRDHVGELRALEAQ